MFKKPLYFLQEFLEADLSKRPRAEALALRCLQIVCATLRDLFLDGQLSLLAMSLVYTTLITLVPLLAISFSVLKGFGVRNQIEPLLLNVLEGLGPEKSHDVTDRVIGFVDNINVGVLGGIGLALLIYAVIALMQKIEAAFNYIWRVGQDRRLSQRFSDYLSVLLMGPLLIFISAGITTTVRHVPFIKALEETSALGPLFAFGAVFVPWLMMAIGFTFVYIYMPNTRVRISAAFGGAVVAALLWKVMGYLFASFIAGSANYVAIYAAFATLIVLMIWLYASWMVVLIGSCIAFYVQHPRYMRISRAPLMLSPRMRLVIGLSVLTLVARAHYKRQPPLSAEDLSRHLNCPVLAIQRILNIFEEADILTAAKEDVPCYYPACPFDQTPLQVAIEALETRGQQGWLSADRVKAPPTVAQVLQDMTAAHRKAITDRPIAQVLLADGVD